MSCQLKHTNSLKAENNVLFILLSEDFRKVQKTASQLAVRDCSEEKPGYIGVFAENKIKAHIIKHKKITANHKSQASQVNVFVLFYVWEDTRVWGS